MKAQHRKPVQLFYEPEQDEETQIMARVAAYLLDYYKRHCQEKQCEQKSKSQTLVTTQPN